MSFLGVTEESYYTKIMNVKLTEKQKMMVGIMVDVLGENRSAIVRRLLIKEAKRCAAELEGEELDLWIDLINQIEKEEDLHEFVVGEKISQGRKDAYLKKTGSELGNVKAYKMTNDAIAQRNWHRKKRVEKRMAKLKELDEKYGETLLQK